MAPSTRALCYALMALIVLGGCTASALPDPSRTVEVSFTNGGVHLAGTLYMPEGEGPEGEDPFPVLVAFHGSGDGERRHYRWLAKLFTPRGVGVLVYDRRGSGASTGDFERSDFFDLARDALAGIAMLTERDDVDASAIGTWGLSQGGWLAPLAASISDRVAFAVTVSGPGVTPAEQMDFLAANRIRQAGFGDEEVGEALALRASINEYFRGGGEEETLRQRLADLSGRPWFRQALIPGDGELWTRDKMADSLWRRQMDYDPVPVLEGVRVPLLVIFGQRDIFVPVEKSVSIFEAAARKAGNDDVTIRVFEGADHGIGVSGTSGRRPAPGYHELMVEWVLEQSRAAI